MCRQRRLTYFVEQTANIVFLMKRKQTRKTPDSCSETLRSRFYLYFLRSIAYTRLRRTHNTSHIAQHSTPNRTTRHIVRIYLYILAITHRINLRGLLLMFFRIVDAFFGVSRTDVWLKVGDNRSKRHIAFMSVLKSTYYTYVYMDE